MWKDITITMKESIFWIVKGKDYAIILVILCRDHYIKDIWWSIIHSFNISQSITYYLRVVISWEWFALTHPDCSIQK